MSHSDPQSADDQASASSATAASILPTASRKPVLPIGPRLRKLLWFVFVLLGLLLANSAYLATITLLEWWHAPAVYQNYFYLWMFLGHLVLGLLLVVPFIVFGLIHMKNTRHRRNRRAVNVGYALFAVSVVLLVSGLLLFRVSGFELKQPQMRNVVYWLHVGSPLVAIWLYVLHRLVGPRLKWKAGLAYAVCVAVAVGSMAMFHAHDPRNWNVVGPAEGEKYFEPSLSRTATGDFIPARSMMNDAYCKECHADTHADWENSAHHLSSFNNPAYRASVRQTREVSLERDGNLKASRWCAGCHDPVPFFSGAFDQTDFDDIGDPTAHAGITCTVCHAITNVNSNKGNGDYTIEEPVHYPFAFSDNALLHWINGQLVKAKPSFHKKTFLKPLHETAEFCSTCHKVHLPRELNAYKDFLRGQNHYDPWLLSGVSGHGARSFYYPPIAETDCNGCHMDLKESDDFGAKLFDDSGQLTIHNHLFPGANTGLAWWVGDEEAERGHREILEGCCRVDIFGIKENASVDGRLHAPLRPNLPTLEPGKSYLLETVIRTLTLGHLFTQGTADSNEIWLDVTVTSGDRVIGRSGSRDESGDVDPWSHFVNVFMLDETGHRIDRRNAQDIRAPLYNHQIPPGAGQAVHYRLELPDDIDDHVTIEVKLLYRKFDTTYLRFITEVLKDGDAPLRGHEPGEPVVNRLPIVTIATDLITLPVKGVDAPLTDQPTPEIPEWQRWNDYGIGLLLEGKAELKQATEAFAQVETLGRYDGPLNLARVLFTEGRLDEAVDAIQRANTYDDPAAPPWTLAWLSGVVNRQQGRLEEAEENFRAVVDGDSAERRSRKFDFSRDYVVLNDLGGTLFDLARRQRGEARQKRRRELLAEAVTVFERVLAIDSENVTAHYNLALLHQELGHDEAAEAHRALHTRYKPDDNIAGKALPLARERYPAADSAAEPLTIYPLSRSASPQQEKTND